MRLILVLLFSLSLNALAQSQSTGSTFTLIPEYETTGIALDADLFIAAEFDEDAPSFKRSLLAILKRAGLDLTLRVQDRSVGVREDYLNDPSRKDTLLESLLQVLSRAGVQVPPSLKKL